MPFYKICLVNNEEKHSEDFIEYFLSDEEISMFKIENETDGYKITFCEKADSLVDIMSELMLTGFLINKYKSPTDCYRILFNKFGKDLLNKEFPDEIFNDDLIQKTDEMYDDKYSELYMESMELSEEKEIMEGYFNYQDNPEIDAAEEEMRRWDEEDPSWRISNDVD